MSYVNPETGEILPNTEVLDLEEHPELGRWGDIARDALVKVTDGPHYRKKRATILKLAEHAFENLPQHLVWTMPHCASRQAHYKWLKNDENYAAAYHIIVGTVTDPGLARLQRAEIIDEAEDLAITALADARAQLRVATSAAVQTLIDGLSASNRYGPKWHERIMAANSILDRADPETAAQQAPAQAIIDKAIMHVYGVAPPKLPDPRYNYDDEHSIKMALPSGQQADPEPAPADSTADPDTAHDEHDQAYHDLSLVIDEISSD